MPVACFHLVDSKKYGTFGASAAAYYRDILNVVVYSLFQSFSTPSHVQNDYRERKTNLPILVHVEMGK